jgi:hypothetical protein
LVVEEFYRILQSPLVSYMICRLTFPFEFHPIGISFYMVREVVFSTGVEAEILLTFELHGDDGGFSASALE